MSQLNLLNEDLANHLCRLDPVQVLGRLSLRFAIAEGEFPHSDDLAKAQVQSEWVAWHFLAANERIASQAFIDEQEYSSVLTILDQMYSLLGSLTLSDCQLDDPLDRVIFQLKIDHLVLRGEGQLSEVESHFKEQYEPHSDWFHASYGFFPSDVLLVVKAIWKCLTDNLNARYFDQCRSTACHLLSHLRQGASAEECGHIRCEISSLKNGGVSFVEQISAAITEFDPYSTLLLSVREVWDASNRKVPEARVQKVLERLAQSPGSAESAFCFFGVNPLWIRPLIQLDGRYLVPIPTSLMDCVLKTFHYDLLADETYSQKYASTRAKLLEDRVAIALSHIFGARNVFQSVYYGQKGREKELDLLVLYDNKLILIECKSKALSHSAIVGDRDALLRDLGLSLAAGARQSTRAKQFVFSNLDRKTLRSKSGHRIPVDPAIIRDVYEVVVFPGSSLIGIAGSLEMLLDSTGVLESYPWCVQILDLELIASLVFHPAQLFDYLEKRRAFSSQMVGKCHDERDILGLYFSDKLGAVAGPSHVIYSGFDTGIDLYLRSLSDPSLPRVPRPARAIPNEMEDLLWELEKCDLLGKSDIALGLLSLSDNSLQVLWRHMQATMDRCGFDGSVRSVALKFDQTTVVFMSSTSEAELEIRLAAYLEVRKYVNRSKRGIGIACSPEFVLGRIHFAAELSGWQYDEKLEAAAKELGFVKDDRGP